MPAGVTEWAGATARAAAEWAAGMAWVRAEWDADFRAVVEAAAGNSGVSNKFLNRVEKDSLIAVKSLSIKIPNSK